MRLSNQAIAVLLVIAVFLLSLLASPVVGATPHPSLDDDGMLVVEGKRIFVLGSYWNPQTPTGLAELRQAGFNLVHSGADRASLDAIADQNLLAWIPLGARISPKNTEQELQLETFVRSLLDHPALAVWEVPDEALWNQWYSRDQQLAAARDTLKKVIHEQEKAGNLSSEFKDLFHEEARARARADWVTAEKLDRKIREHLEAPTQNSAIQMSRAPAAAEKLRQQLLRGYHLLHRVDGRPVWMNYAPRNTIKDLEQYAEAADIVGCDIYPVPTRHSTGHSDLANQKLSSVGDYTKRFLQLEGDRPVWMVLQGFGWRDIHEQAEDATDEVGRRPTPQESRFMLYDAIVRGARGVLYWGVNYAQEPPKFWDELKQVVHEAAALGDVWAARDAELQPKVTFGPTMGSVDRPPRALAKQLGDQYYLLVVNEHSSGLAVRLEGLGSLGDKSASLVGDPGGCKIDSHSASEGKLSILMPRYSAVIVLLQ
jgi:hypothetical protein